MNFYVQRKEMIMKIPKWEFESELSALIEAAKSASNKETARRFLIQADNKIDGYSNIPYELQQEYRQMIASAERELGL